MHRKAKPNIASNIISPNINYSFTKACAQYKLCLDFIERYSKYFFNVWYEEFVNDPEKILNEVCRYLNIEYEPDMLRPGMYSSYYRNPFGKGPVFQDRIGIVSQQNEKYKGVLSNPQELLIDHHLNKISKKRPRGYFLYLLKVSYWVGYFKLKIRISYLGLTGIKKFFVRKIRF